MLKTRIIPCLQLKGESLIKTVKFKNFGYIGDPINTVRIFNELEVDELSFVDVRASIENKEPNYKILREIADECFMPLSYGGGVKSLETAKRVYEIGFEKVILNTAAFNNPDLITQIATIYGSQAVIVAIDCKKNLWGKYEAYGLSGTKMFRKDAIEWAKEVEQFGAGEILLTSIEREGTWKGFDTDLVKKIVDASSLPVIAHGGAGSVKDIEEVVKKTNVSAVALGSMVVYQGKDLGVLVNFPDKILLTESLR